MSKRKVYITDQFGAKFAVEVNRLDDSLVLSIGDWVEDDTDPPSQHFSYDDVYQLIKVLKKKAKKIAPVMDDGPF